MVGFDVCGIEGESGVAVLDAEIVVF